MIVEKYYYSLNIGMDIKFIVKGYNFDESIINVEYYPNGLEGSAIVSGVPMLNASEGIPSKEELLHHIGSYYQQISSELTSLSEEEAQERDKKYNETLENYGRVLKEMVNLEQSVAIVERNNFNTISKYGTKEQIQVIEHIVIDVLKKIGVIK
jgi:hypothetical protein